MGGVAIFFYVFTLLQRCSFFLVCVFVVVGSFLSNSIDFLFQEKFFVFLLVFRIL